MFKDMTLIEVEELIEMYGEDRTLLEIKNIIVGDENE